MKLILDPVEMLTLAIVAILWSAILWIIGLPWWLAFLAGVAVLCVLHCQVRRAR